MAPTKNMKYEQKAVDQSNISAWDPQVFSDMVDLAARNNLVMRQVAMDVDRRLVGSPGSSVDIRERSDVTAADVSENSSIKSANDQDVSHSTVKVSVSKIGVSTDLTREAEEDALGTQADGIAEEHGRALARKNDADAYSTVADTGITNVNTANTSSDGKISYSGVKSVRTAVKADSYDPDTLLIHPDHESDLLDEQKFIDASQYADDEPIKEGEIGRFLGMDVLVSTQFNASSTGSGDVQAVVLDSDRAFVEAVKREPTTETEYDEDLDAWQIVSTMRYGHAVMNGKAIGLLKNAG